jgi:hypothetical protein
MNLKVTSAWAVFTLFLWTPVVLGVIAGVAYLAGH